jgi:hypothetical protein
MAGKNYREVETCSSCRFVFEKTEYDDYPEYFCNLEEEPRPKCGSIQMEGERFAMMSSQQVQRSEERNKWASWCVGKGVGGMMVCDEYEKKQ